MAARMDLVGERTCLAEDEVIGQVDGDGEHAGCGDVGGGGGRRREEEGRGEVGHAVEVGHHEQHEARNPWGGKEEELHRAAAEVAEVEGGEDLGVDGGKDGRYGPEKAVCGDVDVCDRGDGDGETQHRQHLSGIGRNPFAPKSELHEDRHWNEAQLRYLVGALPNIW